jgi:hypothetical protein
MRYKWRSTTLHETFSSSLEILDEMRPIRLIEHTNKIKMITPFVGAEGTKQCYLHLNYRGGCFEKVNGT